MARMDFSRLTRCYDRLLQEMSSDRCAETRQWVIREERATGVQSVRIGHGWYRIVTVEQAGSGFSKALLGAQYAAAARRRIGSEYPVHAIAEQALNNRCYLLSYQPRTLGYAPFPVMTVMEDPYGDHHLLEVPCPDEPLFWAMGLVAIHFLLSEPVDPFRFDAAGDTQALGAPCVIERHSTERLVKRLGHKVVYEDQLCSHCMRCAVVCNEMRALVTSGGHFVLGPSEDFCTNCGLCQKRCPYLCARPKTAVAVKKDPQRSMLGTGSGVYLYPPLAEGFVASLESLPEDHQGLFPYAVASIFSNAVDPALPSLRQQWRLQPKTDSETPRNRQLLATKLNGGKDGVFLIRNFHRAALVLQTTDWRLEAEMADSAMALGVAVTTVPNPFRAATTDSGGAFQSPSTRNRARTIFEYPDNDRIPVLLQPDLRSNESLETLWDTRQVDLILAPLPDQLPVQIHRKVLRDTGRLAQILAPGLPQMLPITTSPVLNRLRQSLTDLYLKHPELLATEARLARDLLRDIPRNQALLHARYRPLAFASGHSACPTCAEAQVLSIPVYMAMAMSLARQQVPQVYFTCETGCMSETLNKTNEVAQKVPGGRTVFGGGFAFGEAIALALDRAVRMGLLAKGKRYVVSQGGDGGSVIGLPAWLNALRQQSFLIRQRYSNVLHFINITDTQVYSNTGGESSATSLLGMGTLTTPIGKFLQGNQKVQWNLINMAAEFPNILVGSGHSADKTAMQEFWLLADRLNQSAMRWDVTPCPETGKFFGEDPDDLAEVMAHAGMLPELVFVGRFRKRVAPYHPDDRAKPPQQWSLRPKPILYWLERDPRYRALLAKNPETGRTEPRNLMAHFLIKQLEGYRDRLNRQIDLETRLVREAEESVRGFLDQLQNQWRHYRYQLDQFPYAFLFNDAGEWKPFYGAELERELTLRMLGRQQWTQYAGSRDRFVETEMEQSQRALEAIEELARCRETLAASPTCESSSLSDRLLALEQQEQALKQALNTLAAELEKQIETDPVEEEIFRNHRQPPPGPTEQRQLRLYAALDRIIEERATAALVELQQHRLARQLEGNFLATGGIIRATHTVSDEPARLALRQHVQKTGPFAVAVASLAGDRGIAINRAFAQFFTAKGAWAGMAWQFGSSKRGTPVLSATFVDSKPLTRKDGMQSFPMAVLVVTNYEEMKQDPDIFFGQLAPSGHLIINHQRDPQSLWRELIESYPEEVHRTVTRLRNTAFEASHGSTVNLLNEICRLTWGKSLTEVGTEQQELARKMAAMIGATIVSVDMDGIIQEVTGSDQSVSNLVAIAPVFHALCQQGLPFDWEQDRPVLSRGFPGAVLKQKTLLDHYYRAMELAGQRARRFEPGRPVAAGETGSEIETGSESGCRSAIASEQDPGEYLMIMGGTLAGMVLSQLAIPEHPLFYIGFPITPAGNPFYAMADAFANGHPYVVVDEMNPSEKVAAEKLLGVGRAGGFLPVTFTASQGWRLFTEIIPQFVGARLEGLFLIAKRALAAPNLNIEESHTDFMSFRDDGGIMLAPKDVQEYVPCLYMARLLTHFAKLPVILSIGGITDTHKIGLVKVPPDDQVRSWLRRTLKDFDFLEHKLLNRNHAGIVHGPSGTAAVYQETQSDLEKAHQAVKWVFPYAVEAVAELTGQRLEAIEAHTIGGEPASRPPRRPDALPASWAGSRTAFVLQGSLYPNAVEALQELEEAGWSGISCLSLRWFNPFPQQRLQQLLESADRVVVLDRSNSFGSIPPLASRIFSTLAGSKVSGNGAGVERSPELSPPILRTLVGGLGGREISVAQMKEIMLSTHLLFHPPQPWEPPLIADWLEQDPHLDMLLREAAALEIRNTNRQTRVPEHLRTTGKWQAEYQQHLAILHDLLRAKNYTRFLANHHDVEFIEPKEVFRESSLLQQVVLYLEMKLARKAMELGRAQARHALLLCHYSQDGNDQARARAYLEQAAQDQRISPRLAETYGVEAAALPVQDQESHPDTRMAEKPERGKGDAECRPGRLAETVDARTQQPEIRFTAEEAARIADSLRKLVSRQSREPLFFNPEDYDHRLLEQQSADPDSQLNALTGPATADPEDQKRRYLEVYRDLIDRTLQREILVQHYAPELADLFEGESRRRLLALARKAADYAGDRPEPERRKMVERELEHYLMNRCFPGLPKSALFYLEYYRTWVAGTLMETLEEEEEWLS